VQAREIAGTSGIPAIRPIAKKTTPSSMKNFLPTVLGSLAALWFALSASAAPSLGLADQLISETASGEAFAIAADGRNAPLWLDAKEHPGVLRAADDLQHDIEQVTGKRPALSSTEPAPGTRAIIIGTLGRNAQIDALAASGKLTTTDLKGKWESFVITTVSQPLPGVEQALVIAGSDKRGTIYGIYELAEQLGVSPWYWWADVPVKKRSAAYVRPGRFASGEPVVKYRGIFINDEEPAFGPWAREKFGGVNSKMYAHMFELILRLRGNYLWPAMWGKAFSEDDPENPRLADEYGIVMGTSHHEPMMRAQEEWTKRKARIGNGAWNYHTNENGLWKFWQEGISRNKNYENLVTIGMRGDGDEPMAEGNDMKANIDLLERIVADQRKLIASAVNPDVTKVPQLWTLYKEVADYYAHGMKVPDDVTLLWCDDNWGNIRRLPTPDERKRAGGAGIYYHFDYVGSPRSYKWLNTNPLPKVWEQMNMAHDYNATRVWVVNVGDLKPMELPIEFFLRMAWNPKAMPKEDIADFTRRWAGREFGEEHAAEIADIVSKCAKYNAWRKPELLEPTTFSLVNFQEAERVLAAWRAVASQAEKVSTQLPPAMRDAFYQLVLYPAKAPATVAEMYVETGRNRLFAAQKRASANGHAIRARELFKQDQDLSDAFHQLADGKWNHMMAQTRIGYTSWKDPRTNILPALTEVTPVSGESLGVAIEGSEAAWPGAAGIPELPAFDSIGRQTRWIDVFRRSHGSFSFSVSTTQPWVKLSATSGTTDQDQRVEVSIDWDRIPVGSQDATVTVTGAGGESVAIRVTAVHSDQFTRENVKAFGGLTGPTAIAADRAVKNVPAAGARWESIPDYGRGRSGMSIFPTTAASILPPGDAPCLEYPVFIAKAGEVRVDLVTGSSLNVQPDRGLRVAVSFDNQPPQVIDAFAGQSYADPSKRGDLTSPAIKDWASWVKDNVRTLKSKHQIPGPGVHTLKIRMVDPGVVLESLIVHDGNLPASYFGPPESTVPPRP
jgi:hypothetical protein